MEKKKEKTTVNLSVLVSAGIKSGEKPKVRKRRKGGRTPLEKETASTHEREPLVADQPTAETLTAFAEMIRRPDAKIRLENDII